MSKKKAEIYVWTEKAQKIADKAKACGVMRKGRDIQHNDAMIMFWKPYDSAQIQDMARKGLVELKTS